MRISEQSARYFGGRNVALTDTLAVIGTEDTLEFGLLLFL